MKIAMAVFFAGTTQYYSGLISVIKALSPITLASSSSTTLIQNTGGLQLSSVISSNTGYLSSIDPQAKMIWDSACSTVLMTIDTITIPCRYDLTIHIHAGSDITSSNPSGDASAVGDTSYTYQASYLTGQCGISIPGVLVFQTSACVPGVTSVAYSWIASPTCPPGCLVCTSDFLNCTTCQQHSYRVSTPDSTGQCPCLPSFYMNPTTELCVACPLNLYCKTCEYNVAASAPKCASCNCAHHRVFNPTTKTCNCDATHQQDGSNIYCVPAVAP